VGGKTFKSKKKIQKRNRVRGGEKIKLPKNAEIRAEKGREREGLKVNLGWHRDRKEHPISAPSIYVGALVGAGSLWPPIFKLGVPSLTYRFFGTLMATHMFEIVFNHLPQAC